MIRLNLSSFINLQSEMTESEMAEKIGVSRTQLWRIKRRNSAVGEIFISKFKKAFPNESLDHYFFIENVE